MTTRRDLTDKEQQDKFKRLFGLKQSLPVTMIDYHTWDYLKNNYSIQFFEYSRIGHDDAAARVLQKTRTLENILIIKGKK